MLVLLRVLPFVLESLEVNASVQLIIKLIEIVQIVFAPVISIATVCRLKLLIENDLKLWKELFPDRNVTPKQHYMIHLEFGLVKNIFLVDSRLYCLEYQPFQTVCFNRNVMAYQVEVPHLAQATELVGC